MDSNTTDKTEEQKTDEKKETPVTTTPVPSPVPETVKPEAEAPVSAPTPETPAVPAAPVVEPAEKTDMAVNAPTPPAPVEIPQTPDMSSGSSEGGYTETKSNKLLYVLVFILVVILLSLAGLFLYKQFLTSTSESAQPVAEVTSSENPTITPGAANEEEAEVRGLDIPDVNKELQDVNLDVNQL